MLNFSNTLKSKTIIILQIFIIIFMGFYIKKNYFSNKIEYFNVGNGNEENSTQTQKQKIVFTVTSTENKKNKEMELIYNDFKTEKSYSYHCLLNLKLKLKECNTLKKEEDCNNETHCKYIKSKEKGKEDKCIQKLDVTETYLFNSEIIQNKTEKEYIVLLFEGENFDGNFIIIDDDNPHTKTDLYNSNKEELFKSLKIINKDYFALEYLQNLANKNNDILLFSESNYKGLCYKIRLQPNEIEDFETTEGEKELKRFRTFFKEGTSIQSIILPGITNNQNDRTFRNIFLEIIDKDKKIHSVIENKKKIEPGYKIQKFTKTTKDETEISKYKVLARYSHLDTKTANKNLRQNELQLKKLKARLNNKIEEMVEKQAQNEEYEDKVMDSLLNRVFDKINNNFDRANYFKDH